MTTYNSPGESGHEHNNQQRCATDLGKLMEELQLAWAQDETIKVPSPMKLWRGPDVEEISRDSWRYLFSSFGLSFCFHHKVSDFVSWVSYYIKSNFDCMRFFILR